MVRPKRALGQNFLTAPGIARTIAREAARDGAPVAIEIGPGTGILTRALLEEPFERVVAIELDPELVRTLAREIRDPRLVLVEGDVRQTPLAPLAEGKPYVIAANIPYYLTGALLRSIFLEQPLPRRAVLMLQREVAERLTDPNKLSLPALWVRLHGTPTLLRRVSRGSFFPQPQVDSAVVSIRDIHPNPQVQAVMRLARAAFSQPRKQLRTSLRDLFPPEALEHAFARANLAPQTRPEDVPLEGWIALASSLASVLAHPQDNPLPSTEGVVD